MNKMIVVTRNDGIYGKAVIGEHQNRRGHVFLGVPPMMCLDVNEARDFAETILNTVDRIEQSETRRIAR